MHEIDTIKSWLKFASEFVRNSSLVTCLKFLLYKWSSKTENFFHLKCVQQKLFDLVKLNEPECA